MFSPREGNCGGRVGFYLSSVARGFHDSCPAWIDPWIVLRERIWIAKPKSISWTLIQMMFQLAQSLVIEIISFQLIARWRRESTCKINNALILRMRKLRLKMGWHFGLGQMNVWVCFFIFIYKLRCSGIPLKDCEVQII